MANLDRVLRNYFEDVSNASAGFATELENDAKQNRPWTDQTGNARRSIQGSYEIGDRNVIIALAIGVDYGKYLELSNGGKYRIIVPTMTKHIRTFQQVIVAQSLRL